ncbi:MAG: phosphatase PAP2 family protein [Patescibacteria group bacterium]
MDTAIFNYLNSFAGRWPLFDLGVIFRAEYFGWWMIFGLGIFLAASFYFKRDFHRAKKMVFLALASGVLSRFIIADAIRFFYDRPRPFEVLDGVYQLIGHSGGGSFPSGHATFFFALAGAVFIYYRKWGILFYLLALAMGISRVIAGVHWPSDILGGAVIGILSAYLVFYLTKNYYEKSQ